MMFFAATAFLVAALAAVAVGPVEGNSCKFTLQNDLEPKKEPLVLSIKQTDIRGEENEEIETLFIANPKVVNGNTGVITVHDKEKLLIACTGRGNSISGNGQAQSYLTCDNGKFELDGQEATKQTTSCTKSYAKSWMKETTESCGSGSNTGVNFQLGFLLNDKSWFPLIDLCHNATQGSTLYASHSIKGHSIRGAEHCSQRRGFSRGVNSLYRGISADKVWSKDGQKKAFKKILGQSYSKYFAEETGPFLSRGHLAPDADFIFNSEQLLTYYFANAAPQWQDFNAGNWVVVENAIRDLAAKEALSIEVYTGTYGVLELPNASNKKMPIFLAPDQQMVPVPKIIWKMVQHPITQACTIAVGHNNIFLEKAPTPICPPKTPDGWPALQDVSKGYTYYCDYEGFAKTVTFAPDIECKDLFEFPEV